MPVGEQSEYGGLISPRDSIVRHGLLRPHTLRQSTPNEPPRQATAAGRSPSACRPSGSERGGHRRRRAAGPPRPFWNSTPVFVLCRFCGSSCVGGL